MIVWLWIGGALMAVGTVLAAFPGRRRRPTDPSSAPIRTEDELVGSLMAGVMDVPARRRSTASRPADGGRVRGRAVHRRSLRSRS